MHDHDSLIKVWRKEHFTLRLWDTYRRDEYGKAILAYELKDHRHVIFSGADFHNSPMHAIDSLDTVCALLDFLSLGLHDVEEDYFAEYTAEQLAWRDSSRREELQTIALYLSEYIEHHNRNRSHR